MSLALPSPRVNGAAPETALKKESDAGESMCFVLTGEFSSSKYNLLLNDAAEPPVQLTGKEGKEAVTHLIKIFGGEVSTAISEYVLALARRPLACRALSRPCLLTPLYFSPLVSPPPAARRTCWWWASGPARTTG